MEKNNQKALALFACFLILLIYKATVWDPYFYGKARPAGQGEQPGAVTSTTVPGSTPPSTVAQPGAQPAPDQTRAPAAQPAPGAAFPSEQQLKDAGQLAIETEELRLDLTYLGGRAFDVLLKNYAKDLEPDSPRLNLVDRIEKAPLPLGVYAGTVNDTWVQYGLVGSPDSSVLEPSTTTGLYRIKPGTEAQFKLQGRLSDGRDIIKTVTVKGSGYVLDVDVALLGAQPAEAAPLELEWTKEVPKSSPSFLDSYNVSGFIWYDGQKAQREQFGNLETATLTFGSVSWAAMADKYFMAALIPKTAPVQAYGLRSGELFGMRLRGAPGGAAFQLFVGPKSVELLEKTGAKLQHSINFGLTQVIAAPLLQLLHFLYGFVGNWGLAIVALTILVKTALYPLNFASFKQMKAMQDLKPEIDQIKENIKDKQQQQVAMMDLYKKRGVNPLGGCLPVLVQMPVFIALYSALLLATELRHAHFAFWIRDLSATERLMVGPIGIPVMVILFVLSMLIQQWMTPSNMDPAQKKVMLIMPIVFGFMFANFPAGLTLYWLTNNLISIGQQKAMQREGKRSSLAVTGGVSLGVFLLAWLVVLLGHR